VQRRIVVVEDDPLMRGLIASVLEQHGFGVVTAANAADATRVCRQTDPDGLVVDIELGRGPNGLDLVDSLLAQYPHLAVVFLSRVPDARFVGHASPAVRANVAWVRKQDVVDPAGLAAVLDRVLREAATLADRSDLRADRPLAGLSSAQVEVLRMIASGLSNAEIASLRGTSVRAVEHMVGRIFAALDITSEASVNPRVVATRILAVEAALPDISGA
jgi:DNA-binding NarL/FixJ family response regulator